MGTNPLHPPRKPRNPPSQADGDPLLLSLVQRINHSQHLSPDRPLHQTSRGTCLQVLTGHRRRFMIGMVVFLSIVVMAAQPASTTRFTTRLSVRSPPRGLSGHPRYRILLGSMAATVALLLSPRTTALIPRCQVSSSGLQCRYPTHCARPLQAGHVPRHPPRSSPMPAAPPRMVAVPVAALRNRHGRQTLIASPSVNPTHSFSPPSRTPRGRRWSQLDPAIILLTRITRRTVCMACSAVLTPTTALGMTSQRTSLARRRRGRRCMMPRRLKMR